MLKLQKSTLRPILPSDAESIAKYANNAKIAANLRDGFPHPYTLENAVDWIRMIQNPENDAIIYAIAVAGEMVGAIGVHPHKDIYRYTAEIGYWLAEPFWHQGIVPEAVQALVEEVFATTELVRIHAEVFEYNKPSMRVLEKCGFTLESIRKKAVCKNNKIIDDYVYVRLRNEN